MKSNLEDFMPSGLHSSEVMPTHTTYVRASVYLRTYCTVISYVPSTTQYVRHQTKPTPVFVALKTKSYELPQKKPDFVKFDFFAFNFVFGLSAMEKV